MNVLISFPTVTVDLLYNDHAMYSNKLKHRDLKNLYIGIFWSGQITFLF